MHLQWIAAALVCAVLAPSARAADELAVGGGHTCLVQAGGKTWCWGWQEQGQVGDGSFDYSIPHPREITGAFDAVAIDAGYQHTCAAMADGTVKCWGYDRWGQIGDGPAGGAIAPRTVLGLDNVVDIGAGGDFSCALIDDGSVKCWGHGYFFQLGYEQALETDAPTQAVKNVSGASAIAVGGEFACALVQGKVKCWGRNHAGQLGRGTITGDNALTGTVEDVTGITDAIDITAGNNHACALFANGSVQCWGGGGRGKLGNNDDDNVPVPVSVQGLAGAVIAIDAGDDQTCATLENGAMQCWGYNFQGTLGNGLAPADSFVASSVVGIGGVSAMGTGGPHACARTKTAPLEVWCWGAGSFGQLGNGQIGGSVQVIVPVRVQGTGFDTIFGGTGAQRTGGFE